MKELSEEDDSEYGDEVKGKKKEGGNLDSEYEDEDEFEYDEEEE